MKWTGSNMDELDVDDYSEAEKITSEDYGIYGNNFVCTKFCFKFFGGTQRIKNVLKIQMLSKFETMIRTIGFFQLTKI